MTLSSKINRVVEDIVVSIYLGATASSVSATATGDRHPMTMGQPLGAGKREGQAAEGFAGGGSWEYDPHARVGRVNLGGRHIAHATDTEVDDIVALTEREVSHLDRVIRFIASRLCPLIIVITC